MDQMDQWMDGRTWVLGDNLLETETYYVRHASVHVFFGWGESERCACEYRLFENLRNGGALLGRARYFNFRFLSRAVTMVGLAKPAY